MAYMTEMLVDEIVCYSSGPSATPFRESQTTLCPCVTWAILRKQFHVDGGGNCVILTQKFAMGSIVQKVHKGCFLKGLMSVFGTCSTLNTATFPRHILGGNSLPSVRPQSCGSSCYREMVKFSRNRGLATDSRCIFSWS